MIPWSDRTNWQREEIVSETLVTVYIEETPEENRARTKEGKPAPFFQFMSVKTRPLRKIEND